MQVQRLNLVEVMEKEEELFYRALYESARSEDPNDVDKKEVYRSTVKLFYLGTKFEEDNFDVQEDVLADWGADFI